MYHEISRLDTTKKKPHNRKGDLMTSWLLVLQKDYVPWLSHISFAQELYYVVRENVQNSLITDQTLFQTRWAVNL